MPAIAKLEVAKLTIETQQRLKLLQVRLAKRLRVSFYSIHQWENGRAQPSSLAMQQIEDLLHQRRELGEELWPSTFNKRSRNCDC